MGTCAHCGESAGWFRRVHEACEAAHQKGLSRIRDLVEGALRGREAPEQIQDQVRETAELGRIGGSDVRQAVMAGYAGAIDRAFEDGVLSVEEEARLDTLREALQLPDHDPVVAQASERIGRGRLLRELLEGDWADRRTEYAGLPFRFLKTEKLAHVFEGVEYHLCKTRTHYTGGSQGVSIRVARGVYYRVGGFKGERYQTEEMEHRDDGLLGLTDRHLYFAGARERFRVRWDRIVTLEPYADGIGIHRDAQTAKPQVFVTGDGWLTYTLAVNLSES